MKHKFIILLILIIIPLIPHTQTIDSLQKKINSAKKHEKPELLYQLAQLYLSQSKPEQALELAEEGIALFKKVKSINPITKANLYHIAGAAHFDLEQFRKAGSNYEKELDLLLQKGNKYKIMQVYFDLGATYTKLLLRKKKAENMYFNCLEIAKELKDNEVIRQVYFNLYETNRRWENYEKALKYYELYFTTVDDISLVKKKNEINRLTRQYKVEKQQMTQIIEEKDSTIVKLEENEIELIEENLKKSFQIQTLSYKEELQKAQLRNQKLKLAGAIVVLVFMLIFAFFIWKMYRGKKKAYNEIQQKNEEIEKANMNIMASINYAKRIQQAILIPPSEIAKAFAGLFIFYKPKDLVSGDFYWYANLNGKNIIAAIDCTGHGVPGAFMSMIGNTLLNEIVNYKKITETNVILEMLHKGVVNALQQYNADSKSDDGMDMALCCIDFDQQIIEFSGAVNPLYIIKKHELQVIKADSKAIGGKPLRPGQKIEKTFKKNQIEMEGVTSLYMFSDGYMDQFGGEANKKYNSTRFKQLLHNNHSLSTETQYEILEDEFKTWKNDTKQIDDVLVIGIKLKETD